MPQFIDKVECYLRSLDGIASVVIAYSGGVDSHALLDACSRLQPLLQQMSFKAVYIDHGLHQDSVHWRHHCEACAAVLNIEFESKKVDAVDVSGEGPEQAARHARYAALEAYCGENTVLLTAQHQDDQAETLMLQLLRGAGIKGLASMPALASFGLGYIGRPLLEVGQQVILDYAKARQLNWVEDSSNQELVYDRNFLRQQLIPVIKRRWPAFSQTTARTASHCAEASSILTHYASSLLGDSPAKKLDLKCLIGRDDALKRLLLRQWLDANTVRMPSEKVLYQLVRLVSNSAAKSGLVEWANYQVYLYDGCLYLATPSPASKLLLKCTWNEEKFNLPGMSGVLVKSASIGNGLAAHYWDQSRVSVRPRKGGECIKLAGRAGRKKLKKLYNEVKIFPWVRDNVPLIYIDDTLAAVANLWVSEEFIAKPGEGSYGIEWYHPELSIR